MTALEAIGRTAVLYIESLKSLRRAGFDAKRDESDRLKAELERAVDRLEYAQRREIVKGNATCAI